MIKVSQVISEEIVLETLIGTLLRTAVEHAGAERGLLILPRGGELSVGAEAATDIDGVKVGLQHLPLRTHNCPTRSCGMLYVLMTDMLNDGFEQNPYSDDEYIRARRSRSILCIPLIKQTTLVGILIRRIAKSPTCSHPPGLPC